MLCKKYDINYIHPDFRGPNNRFKACCSDLVINDIDDAITYAKDNFNVDTNKIYVVGVSGGAYTGLMTFMKTKNKIHKLSIWVPIVDLEAWYHESEIRNNGYSKDILKCTGSESVLNNTECRKRSPLFQVTPVLKFDYSKLDIYAGIYDGIQGSVPITHSINMYNKILSDIGICDSSSYVTDKEKLYLLEKRKSLKKYGKIGKRNIFLKKESKNISLTVFEGNHEILPEYAFESMIN